MKGLHQKLLFSSLLCLLCLVATSTNVQAQGSSTTRSAIHHVLLLSVDGLHSQDLAWYVRNHPDSTLASLSSMGITYTHASTSMPSDSFPGLLSMVTGGTPRSTGVYYDDSYDRTLSPPGSKCETTGTEVVFDESIDKNLNELDGGGGIDPALLPLDPSKGCTPVYPHNFLRVNTIFEVVKAAGLHTAWSDKHPAYDLVNGPSGKGVDDLYNPEIASTDGTTSGTEVYDALKVQAILNEIDGLDHSGTQKMPVPAIFGMNFQAVSVTQKLASGGYSDSQGTPSPDLLNALNFVDQSVGKMTQELKKEGLFASTTLILTAKHGQAPIDRSKTQIISKKIIPGLVESVQSGLLAQATQDDVSLLWLADQSKTDQVVDVLNANKATAGIQTVLSGDAVRDLFGNPLKDSRTPDIVVLPQPGVIYASVPATKIAEHGGFSPEDTHVPILIVNPHLEHEQINEAVTTTQIAPTILALLGLNPWQLQAVRIEHTSTLPDSKLH